MGATNVRALLARLHFEINCALWAALLTGIVFFIMFVAPDMPAAQRSAAAAEEAQFISACSSYCEEWGFAPGSLKHFECMQDLKQFRSNLEIKLANGFFP